MIKKLVTIPILAVVAVATVLAVSNPASAATSYDALINNVGSVIIEQDYGTCDIQTDISDYWSAMFQLDEGVVGGTDLEYTWNSDPDYASIKNIWDNREHWGIGYKYNLNGNARAYVWVTDDPDAYIDFTNFSVPGGTQYRIQLNVSDGYKIAIVEIFHPILNAPACEKVNLSGYTTSGIGSQQTAIVSWDSYGNLAASKLHTYFLYFDSIIYPSGYEGDIILETPPIVPINNNNAPQWYISTIQDFKATIHDTNFNTFENNPFLCADDLAPVLHYEIWRNTDPQVLITSGTQSPTAPIVYDFGSSDIDREYEIVGWYECADGEFDFTEQGRIFFTINRAGTLAVDLFESCIDESFPYIHPENCLNNMYTVVNLLAFGEVTFPTWSFNPACQNLNVLDDWLGLPPNYQVCPQIPASVRNVVTPFVAFMLGLVTMKFLHRRTGDFNG